MNTLMYEHPLTSAHLKIVKDVLKYRVEGPIGQSVLKIHIHLMQIGKGLACGDIGLGAMTEWRDIVRMVVEEFHLELQVGTNGGAAP